MGAVHLPILKVGKGEERREEGRGEGRGVEWGGHERKRKKKIHIVDLFILHT